MQWYDDVTFEYSYWFIEYILWLRYIHLGASSNMTLVYRSICVSSFVHVIKAIANSICTQIFDKTYTTHVHCLTNLIVQNSIHRQFNWKGFCHALDGFFFFSFLFLFFSEWILKLDFEHCVYVLLSMLKCILSYCLSDTLLSIKWNIRFAWKIVILIKSHRWAVIESHFWGYNMMRSYWIWQNKLDMIYHVRIRDTFYGMVWQRQC